ncbi:MAG TPA: CDP-alcohol phosphatidyltransferase family protein [Pirellulales bacterium]|nr:CDP-alcohol phosphatidyltransferase family protein [Pirellulales bacterium]
MSTYQRTSRRPIADAFRATARTAVRLCVRWGVHPDAVSYGSVVASALAGVCFWQSQHWPALLVLAVFLCFVRLWLNMLDGMVALASGKASLRGEILNDLPDRISDVLIFVGAGYSGYCHVIGGYWTAIFALLVAYVGTFGQAVGVQREFSGVMAKPWRMVALAIGSLLTLGLVWAGRPFAWQELTILDWTFLLIIVGCVQSIYIRLARILRALEQKRGGTGTPPTHSS